MSAKVYVLWFSLVTLIVGTILYLGLGEKTINTEFSRLEGTLEEAASIYIESHNLGVVSGEELKVDIKTLLEENFVDNIKVDNKECSGSVIITKKGGVNNYDADITCGSYHSLNK